MDNSLSDKHAAALQKSLEYVERHNVNRKASDRSYFKVKDVTDLDSDGVYEAIVGWHPNGGHEGTDALWEVVGDTMLAITDSARVTHSGVELKFDSTKLVAQSPLWTTTDSLCCPSLIEVETLAFAKGKVTRQKVDTLKSTGMRQ